MKILTVDKINKDTGSAVGLEDGSGKLIWLPKSQIKISEKRNIVEIEVPDWLAAKCDTLEFEEE